MSPRAAEGCAKHGCAEGEQHKAAKVWFWGVFLNAAVSVEQELQEKNGSWPEGGFMEGEISKREVCLNKLKPYPSHQRFTELVEEIKPALLQRASPSSSTLKVVFPASTTFLLHPEGVNLGLERARGRGPHQPPPPGRKRMVNSVCILLLLVSWLGLT